MRRLPAALGALIVLAALAWWTGVSGASDGTPDTTAPPPSTSAPGADDTAPDEGDEGIVTAPGVEDPEPSVPSGDDASGPQAVSQPPAPSQDADESAASTPTELAQTGVGTTLIGAGLGLVGGGVTAVVGSRLLGGRQPRPAIVTVPARRPRRRGR